MPSFDLYQVCKDLFAHLRRRFDAKKNRRRAEKKIRYVFETDSYKEPPISPSLTGELTRSEIEKMVRDAYK